MHRSRPASGSAPPPPHCAGNRSAAPATKGLQAYQAGRADPGLPSGNTLGPAPPSLPRAGRNSRRRHSRGSQEETGTLRTQGRQEQQRVARASPTAHAPRTEFPAPPPPPPASCLGCPARLSAHVHLARSRPRPAFSVPSPVPHQLPSALDPPGAAAYAPPPGRLPSGGAASVPSPVSLLAHLAWPGRPGGRRSPCVRALDFTSG